ncbi:hypothetical protein TRVL_03806 [Trypanosoma vivax]|nr:hypothetical protein TRVL_03806 [Trypanosoma vivax]
MVETTNAAAHDVRPTLETVAVAIPWNASTSAQLQSNRHPRLKGHTRAQYHTRRDRGNCCRRAVDKTLRKRLFQMPATKRKNKSGQPLWQTKVTEKRKKDHGAETLEQQPSGKDTEPRHRRATK